MIRSAHMKNRISRIRGNKSSEGWLALAGGPMKLAHRRQSACLTTRRAQRARVTPAAPAACVCAGVHMHFLYTCAYTCTFTIVIHAHVFYVCVKCTCIHTYTAEEQDFFQGLESGKDGSPTSCLAGLRISMNYRLFKHHAEAHTFLSTIHFWKQRPHSISLLQETLTIWKPLRSHWR